MFQKISNRTFYKSIVLSMSVFLLAGILTGVMVDALPEGIFAGNILGFLFGVALFQVLKYKTAMEKKNNENNYKP
jgi:Na+/H+ antiporter NhaA